MEIGIKISQARREQGITQVELAEKMSVTRQTVSRWESGVAYPDIKKVIDLAEILHVSCDYLLMKEFNMKNEATINEIKVNPTSSTSVTRLLSTLEEKTVRMSFYDDEEDMDALNEICKVEGFEGNWIRVIIMNKKEKRKKSLQFRLYCPLKLLVWRISKWNIYLEYGLFLVSLPFCKLVVCRPSRREWKDVKMIILR